MKYGHFRALILVLRFLCILFHACVYPPYPFLAYNLILTCLFGFIMGVGPGWIYEVFISEFIDKERKADYKDAIRVGIGGVIAAICTKLDYNSIVHYVTLGIAVTAFVVDLAFAIAKKIKNS